MACFHHPPLFDVRISELNLPFNGTRWPSLTPHSEVVGSNPACGCCVPTPTQRAIPPRSVNEYQWKLGSKRAYHAMHWPRIRGLAASADVWLRANEISAAPWALSLGKGLYFFLQQLDEWRKLHDPNFNRFWLIHPCDRQRDKQTDGRAI